MNKKYCMVLLCLLFGSISCSNELGQDEYVQWVHDYANGLHVKKEAGDFVFDVQFTPAEYKRLQNNQLKEIDRNQRPEQEEMQYYTLTVSSQDPGADLINYNVQEAGDKQRRLYYFSYLFQEDIYLEENGKRVSCVLYHFEKPVDLKRSSTFVLGFENPNPQPETVKLVIDSEQFSALPIKIKINKDNIPALKL